MQGCLIAITQHWPVFIPRMFFFSKWIFFCYIQMIKNRVEGNGCVNVLCVFIFCFSSTCVLLVVTRKTKKQRLAREVNILFQSNENTWNFYTG